MCKGCWLSFPVNDDSHSTTACGHFQGCKRENTNWAVRSGQEKTQLGKDRGDTIKDKGNADGNRAGRVSGDSFCPLDLSFRPTLWLATGLAQGDPSHDPALSHYAKPSLKSGTVRFAKLACGLMMRVSRNSLSCTSHWNAAIFSCGVMSSISSTIFVRCSYHWRWVSLLHSSMLKNSIGSLLILIEPAKCSKNFSLSCVKLEIDPEPWYALQRSMKHDIECHS